MGAVLGHRLGGHTVLGPLVVAALIESGAGGVPVLDTHWHFLVGRESAAPKRSVFYIVKYTSVQRNTVNKFTHAQTILSMFHLYCYK